LHAMELERLSVLMQKLVCDALSDT